MMLTFLFFSVIITGVIAEIFSKKLERYKSLIISFSVSLVLTLICVHILPELFSFENNHYNIGYYLLIGFIIQIILELLSKGIEHGHIHLNGKVSNNQLVIIFIGLSIHSFIEGLPINSIDSSNHIHHHSSINNSFSLIYLLMILIHKLPIAAVLIFFLNSVKVKSFNKYMLLTIFAATSPLGAIFGEGLLELSFFNDWSIKFLAISTGMLLHITTLIIFEDHHNSQNKFKNIITISAGIIMGVLLFSF